MRTFLIHCFRKEKMNPHPSISITTERNSYQGKECPEMTPYSTPPKQIPLGANQSKWGLRLTN